jgi:O-antigen/teichoic acid export membrane protein
VITYFTSGWLIRSIYGQEFEPAATPFFWFMIGAVVSSVFFWTIPMLQSLGLVHYRLRIYIVAVIMAYLSGIILIPLYQSSGMAIGILIVNLIVISSTSFLSFKAIQKLKNEQLHVSSL